MAGASAPTFHAPLRVHSPPPPLACRGLQGGTPNPMPSGAPSAKGRVGTLQVGQLPDAPHPHEPVQPSWGLSGGGHPPLYIIPVDVPTL